jgi:hypothetical protein
LKALVIVLIALAALLAAGGVLYILARFLPLD